MADIKISELGAASAVNATDLFPMTASGVTVKATAQQIKNYIGVGNLSDLDTTDKSTAVAAINEVNTKVSKTEVLISIVENGNTCTHTGGISAGQYVNWKGDLYTADTDIAVGTTFASSGGSKNLTAVVDGGLNELNDRIDANNLQSAVSIINYTSSNNSYLCPSDGYIRVITTSHIGNEATLNIMGNNKENLIDIKVEQSRAAIFVKKGMWAYVDAITGSDNKALFLALS